MHKADYRPFEGRVTPNLKQAPARASAPDEGGARGAVGALGNITESAAAQGVKTESLEQALRWAKRRERYVLQAASSLALGRSHRVSVCQRVPSRNVQRMGGSRAITKNECGTAYYSGVGSCGSVWACPVCAQKVSEGRRQEAQHAMAQHRKNGGFCILVTFTYSHGRQDVLKDMVKCQSKALSRMKGLRAYKSARDAVGQIGSIRALEVTHGMANGWHPHVHEIWFLDKPLSRRGADKLRADLYAVWSDSAVKYGLGKPSSRRGVDVQTGQDNDGKSAVSYVTKWGYELTYGQTKKGRGGRTPWQILSDLASDWSLPDNKLWVEYVRAFHGRAQLFWSKGLKALFGVDEIEDGELADMPEKEHVCDITAAQWAAVVWLKKRAEVLEKAESELPADVVDYLNQLVKYNEAEFSRIQRAKAGLRKEIEYSTLKHLKELSL